MNAKENCLEAIQFGNPEYVPLGCESCWHTFELAGNFRIENWTDSWGITWEVGIEGTVPFPKGHPLSNLDRLADYRFPHPSDLIFTEEIKEQFAAVDRSEQFVLGRLTYLLFERAWALMGMDNFLVALLTDPAEAHKFLHGIATYTRGVFDRYLELGVDGVTGTEDLGTQRALMMSPQLFREFFLPEYAYIFENVLREGKMVFFHSCGQVEEIARDLADVGITILDPVQSRANDLRQLKAETVGRMALHGAIDTAVLAQGTPADVQAEVVRVMEILKPGGGWVCAPDQSIPGIPKENMVALWQTAREVGRY